jgi:16S rRNA (adenine1518-N6/adenine1519-N6)-dimethyltransferase
VAQARKRFGQHFLVDEGVLFQITQCMHIIPSDQVLEIGPGRGALTERLDALTSNLTAVEIDRDFIPVLANQFPALSVINADILKVDLAEVITIPTRLVGNLPYNISSPLLLKIADFVRSNPGKVSDGHFMLQREMAERLSAEPCTKAWGRLSVMLQLTFDIEFLFDVAPESFQPPPRVWSSVVRVIPKSVPALSSPNQIKCLDQVLRQAFSARRKRLANALKGLDLDLIAADVDPNTRPDSVTLNQYIALALQLEKKREIDDQRKF